jgi:hypothetical protein
MGAGAHRISECHVVSPVTPPDTGFSLLVVSIGAGPSADLRRRSLVAPTNTLVPANAGTAQLGLADQHQQ